MELCSSIMHLFSGEEKSISLPLVCWLNPGRPGLGVNDRLSLLSRKKLKERSLVLLVHCGYSHWLSCSEMFDWDPS